MYFQIFFKHVSQSLVHYVSLRCQESAYTFNGIHLHHPHGNAAHWDVDQERIHN